jgi:uncharacterized protein YraI
MTRKASLAAALAILVLQQSTFASEAFASQAATAHGQTATAPVDQRNGPTASVESISAYVRLYEKGDTAGDVVCTININEAPHNQIVQMKSGDNSCSNDEAVSVSFSNIPAGSIISLYDDPNCGEGDDWVKFTFLMDSGWTYTSNLELNLTKAENNHVVFKQVYTHKNGLNGKVSCMRIQVPEPH